MLSRKDTEELLSSISFLVSCMERIEHRMVSVEKRLRSVETDHDRIRNNLNLDELARMSREARAAFSSLGSRVPTGAPQVAAATRVAVIVPVFNALAETEACLAALFENGGYEELIVIDDGSDADTKAMLARQHRRRPFRLITNPQNLGYTPSVNIGVRAALNHDIVVVLNSDTVTTHDWIDGIKRAFASGEKIGIVGPLSNAASYQSIPAVKTATGEFATNTLPEGIAPDDIALAVAGRQPVYPRVPVINGFCFAISTAMLKRIGLFDEEAFPVGYGEENDLCLRAGAAGYALVVADDTYVYHAKSASFGSERRRELAKSGRAALERKHGPDTMQRAVGDLEHAGELIAARSAAAELMGGATARSIFAHKPMSIAYILPAKPGGGGVHSIVQEANYLHSQGVRVSVLVPERELAAFLGFYAPDGIATGLFAAYRGLPSVRDLVADFDGVVATVYRSVELVRELTSIFPDKRYYYYIQDYEPYFHPEGTPQRDEALASYDLDPTVRFFAKTRWLADIMLEKHGRAVDIVLPSLDRAIYTPGDAARKDRIAAMVRPSTPRRNPAQTVELAAELARKGTLSVTLFGEDPANAIFDPVRDLPGIELVGRLTRPQVADLFRRSDVFVDLSDYQAFGRASLEAMACGATAIVPRRGGSEEYAVHGTNAEILDTSAPTLVADAVAALDRIYCDLPSYRAAALETASRYSIETAGRSIYKFFIAGGD
jgi:GT2 family glycosyltransferase/glycosyltransferase involved in cell wall biosynthesis